MIKLERNFTPDFFIRMDLQSLTQEFKDNGTAVWHHQEVKAACLKLSDGKCAFCEVKLDEGSTYNEVEHFKDKNKFPDDVIRWENLLPSCRHCNGSKQRHNVVLNPIINPCNDLPPEHLYMVGYRIKGKTDLGITTVDVLNFNHREHKFIPRCKAGEIIDSSIDDAIEKLNCFIEHPSTRRKNILMNLVEAILDECQKKSPFSAVSATMLHRSAEYAHLKVTMQANDLWTDYMQELHDESLKLTLPSTR
ncbi:TPA: hypothetical protein U2J86_005071 [Serratia marcescens]|nr:hypothetical protein [Serratia marcescens]